MLFFVCLQIIQKILRTLNHLFYALYMKMRERILKAFALLKIKFNQVQTSITGCVVGILFRNATAFQLNKRKNQYTSLFIYLLFIHTYSFKSIKLSAYQFYQLNTQPSMLRSQKLLEVSSKPPQPKPPYVKPKHKTYIELLGLDKPKRNLYLQSDDDNDDFLEKLLMKQENEKKKKKKKKRKLKNDENNKGQNGTEKKEQLNKSKSRAHESPSKERPKSRISSSRREKSRPNSPDKDTHIVKQGQLRMWKRMESARKQLKTPTHGQYVNVSRLSKRSGPNNEILVDDQEEVGFIVTNALKRQPHIHTRSQKGLKVMKQLKQRQPIGHNKISIGTVFNPEKESISHNLNELKEPGFKAKILTTKQILAMSSNFRIKAHRHSFIKEQSLFKSLKQEELFIKNLKQQTDIWRRSTVDFKQFY